MAYEHGGDDPDHAEFNATMTLQDLGDQTQVTLRIILESAAQRKAMTEFGAIEGGEQTLARLDAYINNHRKTQRTHHHSNIRCAKSVSVEDLD